MRSGRMRHRVTLERRVDVQAPGGQVRHTYEPFATDIPAEILSVTGREFFAAQQVQSTVSTRIKIRWRPDVDTTCRVVHVVTPDESPQVVDAYYILAALPDETMRRELILMCEKRTAEGWRNGE